ncbi:alpha/beta family hydrolase [Georgenia faecalis]|uniref:Alpha/beta family hydrolase n=1 Tax=Georgenia faecalis TaxID=2483799 RepID=A0ABV9DA02_9MICO|nr:alpha/beta family hydrolase [Georgenia faecalis]
MPSTDPADGTALLVDTPHGPARVHLEVPAEPRALLLLGHGAGGGVSAPDLLATAAVATSLGIAVGLVEQPYRVAGRRAPAPARQLDAAWAAVVAHLRAGDLAGLPLITGGRSSGARVACRTAADVGAAAVLCLAFPLQPPRDRPTRLPELDGVDVPVLVVQGARDPFGLPPAGPQREVVVLPGDHSLRSDVAGLREAVGTWLGRVLPG